MSDQDVLGIYFDEDGNSVTYKEWTETFVDRWQMVNEGHGIRVSTVFLGISHGSDTKGGHLLYESMVWVDDDDVYQERYSTRDEALRGHRILWRRYRRKTEWVIGERITPVG